MSADTLRVSEVFYSIQGESSRAGWPCVFVRLAGCHLRCTYCDTEYAFHGGMSRTLDDLVEDVCRYSAPLVQVTGGEPLLQPRVHKLMTRLCDRGRTVLLETSGACDISGCDPRVIRILDLKTPGSGEADRNDWSNLDHLALRDEVKFVITDRADYEWARQIIQRHRLHERCDTVLLSPVFAQAAGVEIDGADALDPRSLAEWILADGLPVRMQLQMHKFIWDPATRGV